MSIAAVGVVIIVGVVLGTSIGLGAESEVAPNDSTEATVVLATPSASVAASPTPSASAGVPDSGPARTTELLEGLPVVDGYSDRPYDRGAFGQAWSDVDRNGCDTRNDILGRDLLEPVFKAGTNDCKVLAGILIDQYDGQRVEFVSGANTSVLVQIDHVVALGWAWGHGADVWTDKLRLQFANDPMNLVASSQAMNQEKGAFGPSEWLPPARKMQCGYVEQWVAVLSEYDLGINAADKAAAEAVLLTC